MSNRIVSSIHTPQLEDIPGLIHFIQSLLPVKEAARTCILSKSWLHAWSTIPTLRFPPQLRKSVTDKQKRKYQEVINHTLQRYHRDNLSVESLCLEFQIQNQESAVAVEKWIQPIVSKSSLKELSLKIRGCLNDSCTLPNELFSSENLATIKVTGQSGIRLRTRICRNPFIKCVTLRVLDLQYVNVTEEVVHNLLSTCTLLEKIELRYCRGLKNVMLKNLRHLRELVIFSVVLDISNVPGLRLINYRARNWGSNIPVQFKTDLLGSVTQLSIQGVIVDDAFLDIIKSKCPLLEHLKLGIHDYGLESLVITSASLKSLILSFWPEDDGQVNVQVYAPKLLSFTYSGKVNGLHFPTIAPEKIDLNYFLDRPMDITFFLKLREVLNSSSNFSIDIDSQVVVPSNIDVDDLRRRCSFPVTNVHVLCLGKSSNVNIQFFDAFFLIFHPCYIMSPKLVIREMMERQPTDLKDVELKDPYNRKWETLTSSSSSVLDALTDSDWILCKLNWVSQ